MDYSLTIAAIVKGRQAVKQLTSDVKQLRQEYDRIKELDIKGTFESPEAIKRIKEQRRLSGEIVDSVEKTITLEKTSAEQTRKKLLHQIKLNSAIRLYERRQKQTFSTGARDLRQYQTALRGIEDAFKVFKDSGDIEGVRALSEELGRINEQQREINRQTTAREVNTGKLVDFEAKIAKFKAQGLKVGEAQKALDKFRTFEGTNQIDLAARAEKLLIRRLRLLGEESTELRKQTAELRKQAAARSNRLKGAVSSALIGGGFPLLFGQGAATAIGGAAGGLAGGLLGGGFGFALSIVGAAIGDAIQKTIEFNKSLKELNVTFGSSGNGAKLFARDIDAIKKSLGGTRDEALEAAQAFAFFGDRELTTQFAKVFGTDSALLQKGLAVRDPESLRAAVEAVSSINQELGKELALNVLNKKMEEARNLVLEKMIRLKKGEATTEVVRVGAPNRRGRRQTETRSIITDPLRDEAISMADELQRLFELISPKGSGSKADPTINLRKRLEIAKGQVLAEQQILEMQGAQSQVSRLILEHENARTKIQETATAELAKHKDAEDQNLIRLRKIAELKAADLKFDRKAFELADKTLAQTEKLIRPLDNQLNAIKDKAAFEREYGELIMSGVVPAVAQQTVEINKQVKEIDRLTEKQLTEIDLRIETLQLLVDAVRGTEREAEMQERLNKALERRNEIERRGEEAKGAARDAEKTDRDRLEDAIKAIQGQINTLMDPVNQLIALSESLGNSFAESFRGIVDGSMSAQQALANLFQRTADHFLDMAARMIAAQIRMQAVKLFMSFFPDLGGGGGGGNNGSGFVIPPDNLTPTANGNAFGRNGLIPFAKGGVVNKPTLFPFANGTGLMGEAGPEAIMPLSRGPNGRLGVEALGAGAGATNIVVNVDASGSSVEGESEQAAQLGKMLGAAIQAELVKQKRPGGLLAS